MQQCAHARSRHASKQASRTGARPLTVSQQLVRIRVIALGHIAGSLHSLNGQSLEDEAAVDWAVDKVAV